MGARFVAVTAGPSAGWACVAWCRRGARASVGSARARRARVRRDMAALTEGGDRKATRWTRVAPAFLLLATTIWGRMRSSPCLFLASGLDGGSCTHGRI
jgi:hypothetical protein